ncbi:EexN family lipoprotein [Bartonella sp. MM73XJBT]|uniref:EexN family lipoprotein n=1 Tax=Bartonella sp. MM73XJBT TaxID=3019095 RepID=UPI003857E641
MLFKKTQSQLNKHQKMKLNIKKGKLSDKREKEGEIFMNKVLITTLLLCTGFITAGCEKTYSVAEFKKDKNLMEEWIERCGFSGTSKNCENVRVAAAELFKEYYHNFANQLLGNDSEPKKSKK